MLSLTGWLIVGSDFYSQCDDYYQKQDSHSHQNDRPPELSLAACTGLAVGILYTAAVSAVSFSSYHNILYGHNREPKAVHEAWTIVDHAARKILPN